MGERLIAALVCLALLTSCQFIAPDTESLLRPPTLNQQQEQVYAAMDTAGIIYKYPQSGADRSPFLFRDLDGDGLDEAVVFYAYASEPANTRAKVLRQSGGQWVTVHDFSSGYEQVDFIQFAHMLSPQAACMIIGWKNPSTGTSRAAESFLGIYSMSDDTFIVEVSRQPYQSYTVADFDGSGLDRVVTIERDSEQRLRMTVLQAVGRHITTGASVGLSPEADIVRKITVGKLWDGQGAVYIDEVRIDTSVATEIIQIGARGATILAGGGLSESEAGTQAWENYTDTWRDQEGVVLCMDVDGDGQVEVPSPKALPGYGRDSEEQRLQLTQLMRLTDEGFTIVANAVVNQAENYLVYFPDKWMDVVTVVADNQAGEWQFHVVDQDAGEIGPELLRIQAYSAGGPIADNDSIPLGNRGTRYYSGYIPLTSDLPSISERELKEMFQLLSQ